MELCGWSPAAQRLDQRHRDHTEGFTSPITQDNAQG
jgi:hypothetical protein